MFYTGNSKEGVRVDGAVTVYVWDDSRSGQQRKPDRKYVFTANNLQNHYSKSKVGHSYSFWIPWDDAGSDRAELTVVTRFVGQDGTDITTPASKVILPGPVSMPTDAKTTQHRTVGDSHEVPEDGIQQVSWGRDPRGHSRSRRTLRSSEIQVSPEFVKRNQRAAPESFSASDLFPEPNSEQPLEFDGVEQVDNMPEFERQDVDSDSEQAEAEPFNGKPSAQRAARLLQSRFQARRERVAQRSASAPETQPFRAESP